MGAAAAGLAGAVGAVAPGRLLRGRGRVRLLLVAFTAVSATAFAALARANAPLSFALPFALLGLCQGVMIAGANTVVAAATPYERRGAAFGIASSVQALGMMAGPLYAAVFATRSFELGFILLGVGVAIVAALLAATLREPQLHEARPARATAPEPAR
ncbi:MAG: MFS transporter [Dehalococcoidia bacterium]